MSELLLLANFSSETYVLYPDWHHDDESVENNDAAAADGGDDGDVDGDDDGSDVDGDDMMMVMMKLPQLTRLSSSLKQWVPRPLSSSATWGFCCESALLEISPIFPCLLIIPSFASSKSEPGRKCSLQKIIISRIDKKLSKLNNKKTLKIDKLYEWTFD